MTECWKTISSYPLYEVSSEGRVRRSSVGPHSGRLLKQKVTEKGYLSVAVYDGANHKRHHRAHRLVYEAFVGPVPDGREINHKDGNKTNNRPDNLEVVTHQQNMDHAKSIGLWSVTKLNADAVREIRTLVGRQSISNLSRRFGVSRSTIRRAASGFNWRHVA